MDRELCCAPVNLWGTFISQKGSAIFACKLSVEQSLGNVVFIASSAKSTFASLASVRAICGTAPCPAVVRVGHINQPRSTSSAKDNVIGDNNLEKNRASQFEMASNINMINNQMLSTTIHHSGHHPNNKCVPEDHER